MPAFTIQAAPATHVTHDGCRLLSFAGTGYLGLAHHPRVIEAAQSALGRYGLSASASRVTSGNFVEHEALEAELAEFLGLPSVLLTTDGWLADEAILQAHASGLDRVLLHARSHESLRVAARLVGARVSEFQDEGSCVPHEGRTAILTDGVFPTDQRVADLPRLVDCLDASDLLVVDDSHGLGVVGDGGRGTLRHWEVADPRVVVTGSLAKSLGAAGGFIGGSRERLDRVRQRSEAYVGTTPIPPAVAAGARAALDLLAHEPERHARLLVNARRLGDIGRAFGQAPNSTPIPVLSLPTDHRDVGGELARRGMFVPWTSYGGGRAALRIAVTSEHTSEDLDRLRDALGAILS